MKLPDLSMVPQIADATPKSNSLDAMTKLVLQAADGNATLADIGEASGLEASLVQRIVLKLVQRKLLHVEGFAPETPANDAQASPENTLRRNLETEVDRIYNLPSNTLFYELLDIDVDASRKEVRDRYFALSKRFHPDKVSTKSDQDLKHKLEILFARLTKIYDTLSNPKSREEYDKSVSDRLDLWTMERNLKSAITENQEDKKTPPSKPPTATKSSSPPPQTKRTSSRPDFDARRIKLKQQRAGKAMKDLLARVSGSPSSPYRSKSPSVSGVSQGPNTALDLIKKAGIAIERTNYEQAIAFLKEVQAGDPNNPDVNQMMKKAEAGFERSRVYALLSKGRQSRRSGNYDQAVECFEEAIHIDPMNVDARHLLADLLLETQRDLPRALSLARHIVSKGGQHARYFATLGELYLLNEQKAEARSALEQALERNPGNDRYKKLLKACKK
jgi:tetratricopeptide (TPR) repeat protein